MSLTELPERAATPAQAAEILPLCIGDALFHPAERIVEVGGNSFQLEPRLADLLLRLYHAREPVSRDDLINDVWGHDGSDESLTQAISKLRRALGDEQRPYRLIATIPKFGYQIHAGSLKPQAATGAAQSSLSVALRAHISERREFYKGLVSGLGLAAAAWIVLALLNPPSTVEREIILCPPGAPEGECSAMLERS